MVQCEFSASSTHVSMAKRRYSDAHASDLLAPFRVHHSCHVGCDLNDSLDLQPGATHHNHGHFGSRVPLAQALQNVKATHFWQNDIEEE